MASEGEKCGLSSLLPMSCRGRAVAFAKSLHSRLTSLNSEHDSADETSWLTNPDNGGGHVATSQPPAARFPDFSPLESPGSPAEEELDELQKLINGDHLASERTCQCAKAFKTNSDSDSSDVYYDIDDSDLEKRLVNGSGVRNHDCRKSTHRQNEDPFQDHNGTTNIEIHDSGVPTTGDCTSESAEEDPSRGDDKTEETEVSSTHDEFFSTTSDVSSLSLSDESSTLSLRDEDCNQSNCNGEIKEPDKEVYVSRLDVDQSCTVELTGEDKNGQNGDEDDDEEIPRVRRCSSLKTGKTPPGTPGRKKIVRFADALGLDLADVRTFLDEIPKIPVSAYEDLSVDLSDSADASALNPAYHGMKTDKILLPLFQQPGGLPNFLDLVRDNLVCLENALVDDPFVLSIKGAVRVRNLDFHKSVHIRYSLNGWKSFADVQGTYVPNSCDGFSDKFTFVIYAHTLTVGQRLEFACRFQCKGCQYWDNNRGKNYVFQCLPASNNSPVAPIMGGDDWGASFYY